jgi:antitoxin component YwqK of YwqJK toxin-antitoxin module
MIHASIFTVVRVFADEARYRACPMFRLAQGGPLVFPLGRLRRFPTIHVEKELRLMKRATTMIVLTLGWAWLPSLAAGQQAPRPPAYGTPTQFEHDTAAGPIGMPTDDADRMVRPTPASPEDGENRSPAEAYSESESPANADNDSQYGPRASTARPAPLPEDGSDESSPAATPADVQSEVVTERYPNRRVKVERYVVQDAERNYLNHGLWTSFASDGTMIAKGQYEWGKRQGKWSRLYTDIKDDRIAGQFSRQFTAPLAGIAEYVDDRLHGTWKIVDAKQRDVRSWEFKNGKLHGKALTWYPNGKKHSETVFEDGMMTHTYMEWDQNAKLVKKISYKDGRSTVPYTKAYPNGEKHYEGQYLGPRQIYKTTIDFWSGMVEIQLSKKEGEPKRHGKWHEWHQNGGKKFEGEFEEDKPLGRHTWWYPNGQKRAEGEFIAGKEHGSWTWWHENGLKHLDGHFVNGVQTGTWVRWKSDGKVQEVQEHHLGPSKNGESKPVTEEDESKDHSSSTSEPDESVPTSGDSASNVRRPGPRSLPAIQPQRAAQQIQRQRLNAPR